MSEDIVRRIRVIDDASAPHRKIKDNIVRDSEEIARSSKATSSKVASNWKEMAKGFVAGQLAIGIAKKGFQTLHAITIQSINDFNSLNQSIERLNFQYGESTSELLALAEARQVDTRYAGTETLAASSVLAMHRLTKDEIKTLIPIIQDYAAVSGKDLLVTTKAFAEAIKYGSTEQLKLFGVQVEKSGSQQDIFNALVKSGESNVNGFAERLGSIDGANIDKLRNNFGALIEDIGSVLIPSVDILAGKINDLVSGARWIISGSKAASEAQIKSQTEILDLQDKIREKADITQILKNNEEALNQLKTQGFSVLPVLTDDDVNKYKDRLKTLNEEFKKLNTIPVEKTRLSGISEQDKAAAKQAKEKQAAAIKSNDDYLKSLIDANRQANNQIIADIETDGVEKLILQEQFAIDNLNATISTYKEGEKWLSATEEQKTNIISQWEKSRLLIIEDHTKKISDLIKDQRKYDIEEDQKSIELMLRLKQDAADKEKAVLEKRRDNYIDFGESIGYAISSGIENGEVDLKKSLKSTLVVMVNFLQKQAIAAVTGNTLVSVAQLGFAGFAKAAIQAGLITAAFETAKAGIMAFENSGIVPGTSYTGDRVPAMVNSGEMILNRRDQGKLMNMINNNSTSTTNNNNHNFTINITDNSGGIVDSIATSVRNGDKGVDKLINEITRRM